MYQVQQVQNDSDTQIAQYACVIEELRSKIKDMETEHRDKVYKYFLFFVSSLGVPKLVKNPKTERNPKIIPFIVWHPAHFVEIAKQISYLKGHRDFEIGI